MKRIIAVTLATIAASLGGLTLSACGSSSEPFCEQVCACEPCSEGEQAECEREIAEHADTANRIGCRAQFEIALSCAESSFTCVEGEFKISCDAQEAALLSCALQQ